MAVSGVPLGALAVQLGSSRNAIYKAVSGARRRPQDGELFGGCRMAVVLP